MLFGFENAFPQTAHGKVQAHQILVAHHGAGNDVGIAQIDNGNSRVDISVWVQSLHALSALLDARLLLRSGSGDTIELSSGVMLSEWRELARWPEEDRRFASWHRELEAQAQRDLSG